MQLAPFGATPNARGILEWGQPATRLQQHVQDLWGELALNISGHSVPIFAALLVGPRPFGNWDVSDRYGDGAAITQQIASVHLGAAAQALGILQQADLDGYVS